MCNRVATQLLQSVGCLKDIYTGTLQRCLESLEKNCPELEGNVSASDAVKQIVGAAYHIDLKMSNSHYVLHSIIDRLRQFINSFQFGWSTCVQPRFDFQWQTQVVTDLINSLSSSKLTKVISLQVIFCLNSKNICLIYFQ